MLRELSICVWLYTPMCLYCYFIHNNKIIDLNQDNPMLDNKLSK